MPPWAIPTTTSKAWACPRTSTFVHRSDDRTTTARVDFFGAAALHCCLACAFGIPTDKSVAIHAVKAIDGSLLICALRGGLVAASGLQRLPNRSVRLPPTCRGYGSAAGAEGSLPV